MKKKITQEVQVEVSFCNICGKEVGSKPWSGSGATKRIEIVHSLFKTADFDAHEGCINKVVRSAFKKFVIKK